MEKEFPVLPNIIGLEISNDCDVQATKFNMDSFAKSFVNLKILKITGTFIRHSVKLKTITFDEQNVSDQEAPRYCKISVLNDERKKYQGSEQNHTLCY